MAQNNAVSKIEWIPYEYENNLAIERQNLNYNIRQFLKLIGGKPNQYHQYRQIELGEISPIHENGSDMGKIKPLVVAACDFLGVKFEDIFPREVCKLTTDVDDTINFTECQISDILHIHNVTFEDVESIYDLNKLIERIKLFDKTGKASVVFRLYAEGYNFTEISEEMSISAVHARHIYYSTLYKLQDRRILRGY